MFWFIVLLLFVGAGFYFYQKMMAIEREIRAEQEAGNIHVTTTASPESQTMETPQNTIFDSESSSSVDVTDTVESISMEDAVIAEVTKQPGLKQTELYLVFTDISKKQLQKLIKDMTDRGVLKREKQGSSYLLYPA